VTIEKAKQVLLLFRSERDLEQDPELQEAYRLAQKEPELARWFEQHRHFQTAMRQKFRQIKAPEALKAELLAGDKIVRPVWPARQVWLAAAAAVVIFIGVALLLPWRTVPDRFADYRERMVGTALREYRMDLLTGDVAQLRQFAAAHGTPADFVVPNGLTKLQLTGGGELRWRSNPVTMICYDRGDKQMLFLFVLKKTALKDPPPSAPVLTKVHDLPAASWTQGDNTYVLAGPDEKNFLGKYIGNRS
jgi:hypothetical protein